MMNRSLHSRDSAAGVLIAVIAALAAPNAWAAEPKATDPEDLIRQGVELRRQGQSEAALPFFKQAYAAARTPRTAGQLGLSEMALGYWLDAERHLGEALDVPTHPWVAKYRKSLTDALAKVRTHIAEISIVGPPAGAEIRVNGHLAGTIPLGHPLRVPEGYLDVDVTAPEHVDGRRTLSVRGGETRELAIVLEASPAAGSTVSPPASVDTKASPGRETPSASVASTNAAPPASATVATSPFVAGAVSSSPDMTSVGAPAGHSQLPTYLLGGAGLLALGFAIVETFSWKASQDSFNNHLGPPLGMPSADPSTYKHDCGAVEPMRGGSGCQSLYDDATHARTFAIVGYATGAALGLTAAVLSLWNRDGSTPSKSAVACAPNAFAPGLGCQWSF